MAHRTQNVISYIVPAQTIHSCNNGMQGQLAGKVRGGGKQRLCCRVDLEQKQTVMHYQPTKTRPFLKIVVATPNLVTQAKGTLSRITDDWTWLSVTGLGLLSIAERRLYHSALGSASDGCA